MWFAKQSCPKEKNPLSMLHMFNTHNSSPSSALFHAKLAQAVSSYMIINLIAAHPKSGTKNHEV